MLPKRRNNPLQYAPQKTIGIAGAKNAALLAVQILALSDVDLGQRIIAWRQSQTDNVAEAPE